MSLINASHDALPHIDTPPTEDELAAARDLVTAHLAPEARNQNVPHPSLPLVSNVTRSPALQAELDRLEKDATSKMADGIDLSRYEAIDAPEGEVADDVAWKEAVTRSYASSTYLSGRLQNLGLLEKYGKNAWLIGNAQLEAILKNVEAELAMANAELETVEQQRRVQQENVKAEMQGLEQAWRKGVGKVLEVELANEQARQEINQRRRELATR